MASKLDSILNRMKNVDDEVIERDLIAMIYGESGAGKTTLVAGLAQKLKRKGTKILLADSSDGWVSLENKKALTKDMILFPIGDPSDLPQIADAIEKKRKGFEKISVVIIDEGSSVAAEILEQVARMRAGSAPSDPLPEIEGKDYGPAGQVFLSMVAKFHRIKGLHVIVVAHNREKAEENNGPVINRPNFPPLLLTNLMGKMHVVAYVSARRTPKGEYVREVQSQPSALVRAKSRLAGLPVKTSFGDFVTKVSNWVGSEQFGPDVDGEEPQTAPVEDPEEQEPQATDGDLDI